MLLALFLFFMFLLILSPILDAVPTRRYSTRKAPLKNIRWLNAKRPGG